MRGRGGTAAHAHARASHQPAAPPAPSQLRRRPRRRCGALLLRRLFRVQRVNVGVDLLADVLAGMQLLDKAVGDAGAAMRSTHERAQRGTCVQRFGGDRTTGWQSAGVGRASSSDRELPRLCTRRARSTGPLSQRTNHPRTGLVGTHRGGSSRRRHWCWPVPPPRRSLSACRPDRARRGSCR